MSLGAEAIGSAGINQGSLESGVNKPGMGTESGRWPRPPSEGEVLAQTMWQVANHTLGFWQFCSETKGVWGHRKL